MKTVLLVFVASVFFLECQGTLMSDYKPIGESTNATGFRLPGTAFPNSYNLTLQIDFSYIVPKANGQVTINLNVSADNDEYFLYLNSKVYFDSDANATWTDPTANTTQNCSIINYPPTDYIILNCTNPINGTTNQNVTISFTPLTDNEILNGAYVARYDDDGQRKYILATQFEQDWARTVFPCFDEPQYKAPITLTLITAKNSSYVANERIANTRVQNVTTTDDLVITTFEPTPNMSTYLLAFMFTEDFETFPNTSDNRNYTFKIFARKSAENYLNTALTYGPKLVDQMGNFTEIPYPELGNTNLTLAAVPEFAAGAMENWGLITFRETYLIDEGEKTSHKDVQAIITVIAHEVAHQWFGDYVTLDWWSDTWLNEGFAQYFEYYLTDQVFREMTVENTEMWEQFVIKEQQPALKVDAYPDSIPLSNNASSVTTKSDFTKEFGIISYSKGASIIKLLNYTIGENNFKQGLRKYLNDHKYQTATSADLIHSLEQNTSVNLSQYFNEWIYKAGYPVLEVSLNTTDGQTVNIHPKRFSASLDKSGEDNSSIWWIPLTYATPNNIKDEIIWLPPGQNYTIISNLTTSDWILVNLNSLGFYRVNYDETLWNRLIDALKSESFGNIPVINRAQLLDDVFNIARFYGEDEQQKREYYLRAFKLADYLVNETEYHPWYTFFVEIQYLLDSIQDEDTLNTLQKKVLELVSKQADVALLATTWKNQTYIEVLKNELILSWACKVGHEDCVNWAINNFDSYLQFASTNDSDYRDIILCTALANTKYDEPDMYEIFEIILTRMDESVPLKQNSLAKSLGCIKNSTYASLSIQATFQEDAPLINYEFSRMVYPTIFTGLISNGKETFMETLNFIANNGLVVYIKWAIVLSSEKMWDSIASKCYSNDCKSIIADYIEQHEYDSSSATSVEAAKQAVETINTNLKWLEKYENTLISVIENPTGTTESPPESTTAGVEKVGFSILLASSIILLVNLI